MTYLEAINAVLRRLRETEVSTPSQTAYSTLIGDFVNDAREYVEGRHDWLGLEETITVTTASGTAEYEVTGMGESGMIESVVDTTNNRVLMETDILNIRITEEINPPDDSVPIYYAVSSIATDLTPKITFQPTPDGVYSIKVQVDKSGVVLTDGEDNLVVPSTPVVQLAYSFALRERGETGGTSAVEMAGLAEVYIGTAIQRDRAKRPADNIWKEV